MDFDQALTEGRLIRRYKRFLADIELKDGKIITAHTANTGAMLGCAEPGSRVWLSCSSNPKRKYAHTWELVETMGGTMVGINTALPPQLVQEGIANTVVQELQGYKHIQREVRYGNESSRIDLLLTRPGLADCFVEVKNVTALSANLKVNNVALFPDAQSIRAQKHLRELMAVVAAGARAVIFFVVQRDDAAAVSPADHIDPKYGELLRQAVDAGVEAIAYQAAVSNTGIALERGLPVRLDAGYTAADA
ncbi:MAG: DNA/RNA nuclease SfsA [Acidiferrobacterales bacterium]|jgi:sugar fermentation stimulation protein A|nr:DNA/RNA nuclease SfsA [Acidiferrobacterales bacterium]